MYALHCMQRAIDLHSSGTAVDVGLLTDAVRKSPDCVLLLDEIEKAHSDIFNILLQVMDYGVLTDSKGRKAHFKNVILIMTSNAGAQYASQASSQAFILLV